MCGRLPTGPNICGRSSTSFTGRPTALAHSAASATCDQAEPLQPKPPPTNGSITDTFSGAMPKIFASVVLHAADVLRRVVQRQLVAVPLRRSWRAAPSGCGARPASCRRRPTFVAADGQAGVRRRRATVSVGSRLAFCGVIGARLGGREVEPGVGRRVGHAARGAPPAPRVRACRRRRPRSAGCCTRRRRPAAATARGRPADRRRPCRLCGRRGAFIGVSTAITPGSGQRRGTSMRTIRPLGTVLVTMHGMRDAGHLELGRERCAAA